MIIQVYERVLSKGDSIWQYQTIIILMKAASTVPNEGPLDRLCLNHGSICVLGQCLLHGTAWSHHYRGATTVQERCTVEIEYRKCLQCKERAASTSIAASSHIFPTCGRHFCAHIDLTSHLWTWSTHLGCYQVVLFASD